MAGRVLDGGSDRGTARSGRPIWPTSTSARCPSVRSRAELDVLARRGRAIAVVAAGGLAAGAATVAAVSAARARVGLPRPARSSAARRDRDVVASRSFLVDVHVLGR